MYQVKQVRAVILKHGLRRFREINVVKYEIIIYWSREDDTFIAEVPELPGCAADGSTYQEALDNVQVIIREWIETTKKLGREIPEPKGRLIFASVRPRRLSSRPIRVRRSDTLLRKRICGTTGTVQQPQAAVLVRGVVEI